MIFIPADEKLKPYSDLGVDVEVRVTNCPVLAGTSHILGLTDLSLSRLLTAVLI